MSQGIFALGAIVGPAIGPTIGGWLTDNYSWNWIFFINVLPGAFAGTVLLMRLKNPVNPRPIPVDGIGLVLLMLGLGCLQYILDEGQRNDWFSDDRITACAVISALGLIGFVVWELWGTKRPIVDLRVLMRYRQIGAGASLAFVIGGAIFGAIVVFPQYVQGILGFTATASGELIFYRAAFIAVGAPLAVRLATSGRVDVRWLLFTGFVIVGVTQFWFAAITTSGNDFDSFILPNMISGIGFSLLYIPLSIAILTGLPPDVIPKAASFQSLFQQLGGSISTAGIVTLLARRDAFHQTTLAAFAQPGYAPFAQFLNQHGSLARFYQQVVIQADTMGFADAQWVIGVLALVLIPMILVLPNSRKAAAANVSFE
jgi:DHA2 family multidrug resistance protein